MEHQDQLPKLFNNPFRRPAVNQTHLLNSAEGRPVPRYALPAVGNSRTAWGGRRSFISLADAHCATDAEQCTHRPCDFVRLET